MADLNVLNDTGTSGDCNRHESPLFRPRQRARRHANLIAELKVGRLNQPRRACNDGVGPDIFREKEVASGIWSTFSAYKSVSASQPNFRGGPAAFGTNGVAHTDRALLPS